MIDVNMEFEKYETIDMEGAEEVSYDNEISQLLNVFSKTVERIGKEQYKSSRRLGEIWEVLDEDKSAQELVRSVNERIKDIENENITLIKTLIEIGDLFEDIYVYSQKSLNKNFEAQMKLQWHNIKSSMLKCGLTPFGEVGEEFNTYFHMPKEVKNMPETIDRCILEVIKSGYNYRGNMIRKAEVVING